MKPVVHRALIGLLCGTVSSPLLCWAFQSVGLGVCVGALLGMAQGFLFFDLEGGSALDRAMTGAALGVPLWAALNVLLLPWLAGQKPPWDAEGLQALLPALLGWWGFGGLLGTLAQAVRRLSARARPGTNASPRASPSRKDHPGGDPRGRLRRGDDGPTARAALPG